MVEVLNFPFEVSDELLQCHLLISTQYSLPIRFLKKNLFELLISRARAACPSDCSC